jgi:hypothetical protein
MSVTINSDEMNSEEVIALRNEFINDSCSSNQRGQHSFVPESICENVDSKMPSTPQKSSNTDDSSSPDDDGNSTDALADAFSYSLAHIAAAGRGISRNRTNATTVTNSDESHTRSNTHLSRYPTNDKSCVSATNNSSSSSDDRGNSSEVVRLHRYPCHALMDDGDVTHERPHYHRHHKRQYVATPTMETIIRTGSDLQPPFVSAQNGATVVIAPLTIPLLRCPHTSDSASSNDVASSNEDMSRVVDASASTSSLLQPYSEACFHTIRKTFLMRKPQTSLAGQNSVCINNQGIKRKIIAKSSHSHSLPETTQNDAEDQSGISSGSDGGYSASYSSNGSGATGNDDSCVCSSDEDSTDYNYEKGRHKRNKGQLSGDPMRPMLYKKQELPSTSSDIADFSSSFSLNASKARSESTSVMSSSNLGDDDEDSTNEEGNKTRNCPRRPASVWSSMPQRQRQTSMIVERGIDSRRFTKSDRSQDKKPAAVDFTLSKEHTLLDGKIPILSLGCDVMAHVLTFLEPPDVLDVLTMPLSKGWFFTFSRQPELWRVLCLLEPFKAHIDDDEDSDSCGSYSSSDDESISFSTNRSSRFRLQYASYVRCMRCLDRIRQDAVSGRPLSVVDYAAVLKESGMTASTTIKSIGSNQNLQHFLARARGYVTTHETVVVGAKELESKTPVATSAVSKSTVVICNSAAKTVKESESEIENISAVSKKKIKFGHSKLTQRLLGPTLTGSLTDLELPWTYGIYSIVNWMVAYSEVEGIQTMCLQVLPFLLENEQQRITAQRAGLTDIVLRDMVLYPNSVLLHTAAFHTIVLLARPLGGQEGMLFHTSMVNSSGIFGSTTEGSVGGKSGIAVLVDSMRRFELNEALQSMACWSLVNIALAPSQKEVLVKLGGIEVIAQAMVEHQYSADVQFRALFALINLVIPSVASETGANPDEIQDQDLGIDTTEKEMLDEMVDQIVGLVVLSMKNYCSHEAILNRACLVLHNLSLSPSYHTAMLWTPNCYQMLEWCLSNFRTDQVLQQSAAGTLHRLQTTLSGDETLRLRFVAKLQTQQKELVEQVNQDVIRSQDRH